MEIVDACDALPCNAEVLQFLRENRSKLAGKSSKDKGQAKAATVVLETLNYLEKTPAGNLVDKISSVKLNDFMTDTSKYNLTDSERLQILNHCPKSAVEIQLLVEDSEERLSETEVNELLSMIKVQILEEDEEEEEDADDNEENGEPLDQPGEEESN